MKWIGTFVILLALSAGAVWGVWWWGGQQKEKALEELRTTMERRTEAVIRARGNTFARAVATLSEGYIAAGRYSFVQEAFDDLVREPGISSISFYDLELRAIVATDRNDLGEVGSDEDLVEAVVMQEPHYAPGSAFFPVMGAVHRLGTLWVRFDPKGGGVLPPLPSGDADPSDTE